MTKNSAKGRYTSPDGSPIWEYITAASCFSLIFSIGAVLGWGSPSLRILLGPESPIPFTDSDASIIGVCFGVGFTMAPVLTTLMADNLGRKISLLATGVPILLHWGLIAVAKDASVLYMAKLMAGTASGLGLNLVPMYLGEISSVKLRGAMGMIIGTMTNAALLCIYSVMPYVTLSTSAWIFLSIAALSMISLCSIPESPYFLAMVGKFDEAESVLEKLRGKTDVTEELELVKKTVSPKGNDEERLARGTPRKLEAFKQMFRVAGNRKAIGINFLFSVVLQLGGYVVAMSCGHIILEAMNTGISTNLSANITAVVQLVFNILAAFVVDRFGRKPLLCTSGVLSGACTLVIGVYFYLIEYTDADVTSYKLLPLIAWFVNIAAMSIGIMPLQMVILSEILDSEIKAIATSTVGVASGVISIISITLYLQLAISRGYGHSVPFLSFPIVTWIATAFMLKLLPETKGKTFLEIQKDLNA